MIEENDTRRRRCPRLGHGVPFSYCRHPGEPVPCGGIYDCWWETFDIRAFMERHYEPDVLRQVTRPKGHRLTTLMDLVRQAQQRTGRKEGD
jgi:hypothetical protein